RSARFERNSASAPRTGSLPQVPDVVLGHGHAVDRRLGLDLPTFDDGPCLPASDPPSCAGCWAMVSPRARGAGCTTWASPSRPRPAVTSGRSPVGAVYQGPVNE